eukprot:1157302-Pelagomonas_calceolata.AAC.3
MKAFLSRRKQNWFWQPLSACTGSHDHVRNSPDFGEVFIMEGVLCKKESSMWNSGMCSCLPFACKLEDVAVRW